MSDKEIINQYYKESILQLRRLEKIEKELNKVPLFTKLTADEYFAIIQEISFLVNDPLSAFELPDDDWGD